MGCDRTHLARKSYLIAALGGALTVLCILECITCKPAEVKLEYAKIVNAFKYANRTEPAYYLGGARAIAANEQYFICGAQGKSDAANGDVEGFVDIHKRDASLSSFNGNWYWIQRLKSSQFGETSDSLFGSSVSINDELMLIGAPGSQRNSGAVYVFEIHSQDSFVYSTKLTRGYRDTITEGNHFGWGIAAQGDWIAISGPYINSNKGRVELFYRTWVDGISKWAYKTYIDDGRGSTAIHLGISISMYMDRLAIGLFRDSGQEGAVYIYRINPGPIWRREKVIFHPYSTKLDFFGFFISMHIETIAVGAPAAFIRGGPVEPIGAVYVYEYAQPFPGALEDWNFRDVIYPLYESGEKVVSRPRKFGSSVSVYGSSMIVGDIGDEEDKISGVAYVYSRIDDTWMLVSQLRSQVDRLTYDAYASSVLINPQFVAVGAPTDPISDDVIGSVHLYDSRVFTWAVFSIDRKYGDVDQSSFINTLSGYYNLTDWQLEVPLSSTVYESSISLSVQILSSNVQTSDKIGDLFVYDVRCKAQIMKDLHVLSVKKNENSAVGFGKGCHDSNEGSDSNSKEEINKITIIAASAAGIMSVIMIAVGLNYYVLNKNGRRRRRYYSADGSEY